MQSLSQQDFPRSKWIMQRTMEAIHASGLNVLKFASRVAENYQASTAPFNRVIDFYDPGSSLESATRAQKANGSLVDRWIKAVVRFPDDLEESWVDALPEPYRSDLIRELAQRYGLIGAKLPALSHDEHIARLADVLSDAGRTAQTLAPMFGKGKLEITDRARVDRSLHDIDKALADLHSLREQIAAQLPKPSAPTPFKRRR